VAPLAVGTLGRADEQIEGWHRLLAAYDVERQLERGYTLTLDANDRIVRSARTLAPGTRITTRFTDGAARSSVESVDRRATSDGRNPGTNEGKTQ
jgi:exonuclease VII large subunit